MGSWSWIHWLIVGIALLLLFGGRGKISELMGDFATGIKAFKKGMAEDDSAKVEPPKQDTGKIDHPTQAAQPETHKAG